LVIGPAWGSGGSPSKKSLLEIQMEEATSPTKPSSSKVYDLYSYLF
jgi:hypothetical protein